MRIADSNTNQSSVARIHAHRARLNDLQERVTTGKRINRPSDDPTGTEAVIRLRTSQAEVEGFRRNAQMVSQKLTAADVALNSYLPTLDRMRTLVSAGYTDTATPGTRRTLAVELEGIRERLLNMANQRHGDDYLFGGTRHDAPPFDPATAAPAATPAAVQYVGIEPGGGNAVANGVTAETVFADATSDIFADLTLAIDALSGTGDPVADKATLSDTFARLGVYTALASDAQTRIGITMHNVEQTTERLGEDKLSLELQASEIESADMIETAVKLSEAQSAFEAALRVTAQGRRSLLDFMG